MFLYTIPKQTYISLELHTAPAYISYHSDSQSYCQPYAQQEVMTAAILQCPENSNCKLEPFSFLDHIMSCDNDKRVERWILANHSPTIYAQALSETLDSVVFNQRTKEFSSLPSSFACVCSWSCQDVFPNLIGCRVIGTVRFWFTVSSLSFMHISYLISHIGGISGTNPSFTVSLSLWLTMTITVSVTVSQ